MYNPMTWRDDNGEPRSKASKSALIRRLFLMERFYTLYRACLWTLEQYKDYALLVRSNKLQPIEGIFIGNQLPRYRREFLRARQRLNNLYKRIGDGDMTLPEADELSPQQNRTVTPDQLSRLLTVLQDNGVDPDEAETVAEVACYVLDMDVEIPCNSALVRLAHSFPARYGGMVLELYYEPLEGETTGTSIIAHVDAYLDTEDMYTIEDAIASYIEDVPTWSFEQLIRDVLQSFSYRFTILTPAHTFHV